ncbi:ABC transporter ATP-binding protein [Clostridium transplantifaecale]|uniref:ABC transporter ATP-binding protein n=1 Tax=Clostridium transplantifaecale TaxID=2479838 RepID=UPI000F63AF21|nr:ABC transporter ATP-binding protein [Clostridium transplantifaecale]
MIPKLEVSGLCYSYHSMDGETQALSNISFTVNTGEFIAIVGPSGCGKSTLLSLFSGLLKPDEGKIFIDGTPLSESQVRIGYMLQKDHLFEWRTILSNASLGLEIQHKMDERHKNTLQELMTSYGLGSFENARPSELSGGMRQRAALIRTLALEPDILLLDEPFSALDYQTRLSVCDDISTIIRGRGKTAILITHDLSEAVSVADRIIILSKRPGRIKGILPTPFSTPDLSPLERRNDPEFSGYFNEVWKILQN